MKNIAIPLDNYSNLYLSILSLDGSEPKTNVKEQIKTLSPYITDSSKLYIENGELFLSSYSTNRIPFMPYVIGDSGIKTIGDTAILYVGDTEWMSNSIKNVNELYSQYVGAYGNVLVTGLGLGIVALLVATKPDVSKVTVLETNKDIIKLFELQGYGSDKIEILNESCYVHEGTYDCVLVDHYNLPTDGLESFFQEELKRMVNIHGTFFNFYGWEALLASTEDFISSNLLPPKYVQEKRDFLKWYKERNVLPEDLIAAIKTVNSSVETKPYFSQNYIKSNFEEAKKSITKSFSSIIDGNLRNDYCIYRLGDKDILAYGVSWTNSSGESYSAKVQKGAVTDLYKLHTDGTSSEIDKETYEILYNYTTKDSHKTDLNGEIVQYNYKTNGGKGLPSYILQRLVEEKFPFVDGVVYWAEKPYGTIVEFHDLSFKEV